MTTLALTPDPSNASVLIEIAAAPAGPVVITRTDANGTSPVRLRTGQVPIAGALIVSDYEAALTGSVSYDVVDSASATTSGTTALTVAGPRIASIQLPALAALPQLVTGYESGRATSSIIHRPIGRTTPIVLLAPARTREGRLTLWAADFATATSHADVLSAAAVFMLRQPDHAGLDMYFALAGSVDVRPLDKISTGWCFEVVAEYVEVRSPSLPLLGAAGWTFDDVAAYADFASVRALFADFGDLVVGP